jgi:UDPglucose 6-dehydrogenase
LTDVDFCDGPYSCAQGADALVIVTEWEQFRALDFERLKAVMKQLVLVDLRNVYRPGESGERVTPRAG